ncbi:MAG: hypothetical protein JWO30_504 [Fibrobacteres bacterium]|nr:hypothetical protein [Fibrobacterota bacterium]
MNRLLPSAIVAVGLLGCYGGKAPVRSPDGSTDAPAVARARTLPLLVLGVAQIYTAGSLADFSLFNLVESWHGSDPASLRESMKEIQSVKWKGEQYFLIATRNRLDISTSMEGGRPSASLAYDPGTLAWYAETGLERTKLAEWTDESRHVLMLIHPDGTRVAVRPFAHGRE